MSAFKFDLPEIIREPKVPPHLRERFKDQVALSNSRRLRAVTWLLLSSLVVYLVADYFTIKRAGVPNADAMWTGILVMRPFAFAACGAFLWLFGPLRSIKDIGARHRWVWQAYVHFFLVYTAVIVAFMFPLKESIGPVYIFLLGPSAFIAMTTWQVTIMLALGMTTIAGALFYFVPDAATVKYHLINVMVISWVSFVVAHVTYSSTYRDFMNKQLIEEKNLQLEKAHAAAEAASQAKSEFLAAVSHEIRTPMNSILGMTEVALHTPLSSEQRDYVETARESALHLLDVINDILDFSRIEANKLRLFQAHFDLPSVVNSAIKTVRLQAERKGVALDMEIGADTPRFLKGDPGRLRQVLINLLNNAITYTDEGSIRVTVGPWHDGPKDEVCPIGLRFSVKDSGVGIDSDRVRDIFEPFTQADGSASRTYGGSGLGLSICKTLVGLMGGEIHAESTVGKGSEFTFTACFGEGDARQASEKDLLEATPPAQLPIKSSRILLVDDNPLNVKVEKLHLDRMGMETTVAESGTEALMLLADHDYDLVLLDLEMPGMDGYETARRIRSGKGAGRKVRQPEVPILAVTAHALAEARHACDKCGMNGFVTKPVGFGELGSAMRHILGGDWRHASGEGPAPPEVAPVLDLVAASTHLGVSRAEVHHLVPHAMEEIGLKLGLADRAVRSNTLREVALQSHTLKSVAASIGAEATRQAALKLENAARREDLERCYERMAALRLQVERLEAAVARLA